MSEQTKFNVGDRVKAIERLMYLPPNITGVVVGLHESGKYKVQIDEEDDLYAFYEPRQLELIQRGNYKQMFLYELKELLAKYDAEIDLMPYCCDTYQLGLSSEKFNIYIEYHPTIQEITAANIMDYEKE